MKNIILTAVLVLTLPFSIFSATNDNHKKGEYYTFSITKENYEMVKNASLTPIIDLDNSGKKILIISDDLRKKEIKQKEKAAILGAGACSIIALIVGAFLGGFGVVCYLDSSYKKRRKQ